MQPPVHAGLRTSAGLPARGPGPAGWTAGARRASGFTIVELIVSLGVLGILGTMAGAIFALTLKSSGQASALIEVSQAVRALEQSLREDLRHVDPGSCILAIQSNPVHAYWTADEQEALSAPPALASALVRDPEREVAIGAGIQRAMPRADMLMFFTYRPGTSFRNPDVNGRIQCVVYGHAETGELQPDGRWLSGAPKWFVSPEDRIVDASAVPNIFSPQARLQRSGAAYTLQAEASTPNVVMPVAGRQWHLARRGLLFLDRASSSAPQFAATDPNDGPNGVGMMSADNDPLYSGLNMLYSIRDGRRDYVVDFPYEAFITRTPDPRLDTDPTLPDSIISLMYRSQMDAEPPATQAQRMGHYFLPNCASFKVEWAMDVSRIIDESGNRIADFPEIPYNREMLWIDPQRLAETIDGIRQKRDALIDFAAKQLMDEIIYSLVPRSPNDFVQSLRQPERFVQNPLPAAMLSLNRTHLFYPRDPSNLAAPVPDPLFPRALRVTVDVYDSGGRLERPIRHVMIVPVGQG